MTRTCEVEGCPRKHHARGYCSAHYQRLYDTGDVRPTEPIRVGFEAHLCSVPGCVQMARSRGLCSGHLSRLRGWGDVRADLPLRAHLPLRYQICAVKGCGRRLNEHSARGLCGTHYRQLRTHGRFLNVKPRPYRRRQEQSA